MPPAYVPGIKIRVKDVGRHEQILFYRAKAALSDFIETWCLISRAGSAGQVRCERT